MKEYQGSDATQFGFSQRDRSAQVTETQYPSKEDETFLTSNAQH